MTAVTHPDRMTDHFRFCAGFWTPANKEGPHAQLTGVQKAPRHGVAGGLALAGQRVLWGFDVGVDVDDGRDAGGMEAAERRGGEVGSVQ